MIIIHATQKLINTSRLEAALYISQPSATQMLHSWYCSLLPTGFPGKLMVIYVHEPSLLTIVCRGKTIKGTWDEFRSRLQLHLKKFDFLPSFIESESALINDFVVSKTNSRSMLAHINQIVMQFKAHCIPSKKIEDISQYLFEEIMMKYPYQSGGKNKYTSAIEFWKEQKVIL